jgi:hypothetical protein
MGHRGACPSCQHRLSPLAVECPVCGLSLAQRPLPRPLLFQASAITGGEGAAGAPQAIATPALGRVAPVPVAELEPVAARVDGGSLRTLPREPQELRQEEDEASPSSFWPLAQLESGEAMILVGTNLLLVLVAALQLGAGPLRVYGQLWPYLLPLHLALSWVVVMVPLVLVGQSPLMALLGLTLASPQPERRMAFSLFHLLSVCLFPLSFLCMVLTPNHRTLAELLTGQEILFRPLTRMR